jgi:hypothetical protein
MTSDTILATVPRMGGTWPAIGISWYCYFGDPADETVISWYCYFGRFSKPTELPRDVFE